jgi:hypothetical protein
MDNFGTNITSEILAANNGSMGRILKLESLDKGLDFKTWLEQYKDSLDSVILEFGGILFRNFGIDSVSEFNKAVQVLCPNLLSYIYRSTPRTKLGGNIYTATEYPKTRSIPFHNENSYSKSWPNKIFFYSAIVAEQGGETPIANSRQVYLKIDPSVRAKFEQLKVMYVRNYMPGVDLSWQEVFQTTSPEEVNRFCKANDIEHQWISDSHLRTKQICQAVIKHPLTKEDIWFNQAHLFHISALDIAERDSLIKFLGEENIPRNSFYGNGEAIEEEVLNHIREMYTQEKIIFSWCKGDMLMLDNILMAHSREPFEGVRKVAVAMG